MLSRFSRMLIVDDDTSSRRSTHRALVKLGYDNIEGCGSPEAMRRLSGLPYRLVVADWSLQAFHGLDFLKLLRAEPQNKATPVVFLVAPSQRKFVEVARDDGTTYYLQKPLASEALADRIFQINLRLTAMHPAALQAATSAVSVGPGDAPVTRALPRSFVRAL